MKKTLSMFVLVLLVASSLPISMAIPEPSFSGVKPQAIQAYNTAKEKYQNSVQNWENSKENYLAAKEKVRSFNRLTAEEKEQSLERIDNFLLRTIERMENHVEILKKWTEMIIQDKELKEEMLAQLNGDLDELEGFKERLTTGTLEASDLESLRQISKDIKEYWQDAQSHLKKYRGILLTHRIYNIIEKSEAISERFHTILDEMTETEVTEMKDLLESYDENIASAKEKYEEAKDIYLQMEDIDRVNTDLQEIKKLLREAHKYLRDAHENLRELIKLYRDYTDKPLQETLTPNTLE